MNRIEKSHKWNNLMVKCRKLGKNDIIRVFLINFLIAFLALFIIIVRGNGIFTLCNDFNEQQIPFHMLTNEAIKKGNFLWNWNIDLGSSFIGAMGYYTLGSPFFWLTLLFPKNAFPYLAGWIYMLKYAIAGVSSFLYLRRFVGDKKFALLGSVLYAFSGFQTTNLLFYSFHDAVAFFPFMLLGLEKLIVDNKKGEFAFSVFLNAFINYYFFVQEVIFIIIYYLCRQGLHLWKKRKEVLQCTGEGLLGISMAAVLLYPSVLFTLSNPRISNRLPREYWIDTGRRFFLKLFRVFLFPGEMMAGQSCITEYDWSSWSAYLPMVGIGLVLCYVIKKRSDWLSRLLIICSLFVVIPLLNSVFMLLSDTNYHRWYFMLILFMALASVRVLEDKEKYPVKIVYISLFIIMTCSVFMFPWWSEHKFELIYRADDFRVISVIGVLGIALTLLIMFLLKNKKVYFSALLIGTGIWSCITTAFTCNLYQKFSGQTPQDYYSRILTLQEINEDNPAYRFQTDDNTITLTVPVMGTGSFNSTVNGSIFEFYDSLGEPRAVFSPKGEEGLQELLSAKYYITDTDDKDDTVIQVIENKKKYYVYEKDKALPIGFTYDSYITKSEFLKADPTERALLMLKTLVVPDEAANEVSKRLTHETVPDKIDKEKCMNIRLQESSVEFKRDSSSFYSVIYADSDKYAFFSVPNDKGWKAFVNGISVDIVDCNGLMAVPIEKGENQILFKYVNKDFAIGAIISLAAFLLFGWLCKMNAGSIKKQEEKPD